MPQIAGDVLLKFLLILCLYKLNCGFLSAKCQFTSSLRLSRCKVSGREDPVELKCF